MSDILKREIRFVWVPNQLEKAGRVEIYLPFVAGKKLREYLDQITADVPFSYEGKPIISSRDARVDDKLDTCVPQGGDEILVLAEIKDPISIIIGITVAAIAYGATAASLTLAIALGALAAFAVYSMNQKPRQPSFGTATPASSGSMDAGSPTYGWDGVQSYQDVGTPVPVVYGVHRKGGNIINQYVFDDGDKQYLNLLFAMCEGEIEAIEDVEINENPADNFNGVSTFFRMGTNDQSLIDGFDELHSVVDVGSNLLHDDPFTYTTDDTDVEAFELQLLLPAGLYEQSSGGDMQSLTLEYQVEYKEHSSGTWIDLGTQSISATSRTAVRRKFRKEGLTPAQYDIRITRLSEDSTLTKIYDLRLDKVDEIRNDALIYPNTALMAVKLLASDQLSGGIPNITALVQGTLIKTYDVRDGSDNPVDYEDYYFDPDDQEFKLIADDTVLSWDGESYVTAFSANPAWCMYDLITNNRYGLGDYVSESVMDLEQFVEMAKYCDELVPDGNGDYEKRFRMDVVIDSDKSALDILNQLAATFRAWPFYSAGAVKLRIDKAENPVQLFAMGNIIEGSFQQSWKTLKDIPNMVEVQYLDREKNYDQEMIAYIDEASLEDDEPIRKKTLRLFITQTSRALREARYALLVAKYIHRTITFKAAIDGIACQAGDVIRVAHELPQWSESGRIVSGTSGSVTLDKPMTLLPATTYKIRVRHSDDTTEEKTVTNSAGEASVITISGSFSTTPAAGELWVVGESNVLTKNFRITQIKKNNKNEIEITAIEYNESVYDDSAPTLPNSNFTDPTAGIPSVRDLALTERIAALGDGTIQNIIDVWFNKPDLSSYPFNSYGSARIYISDDDGVSWLLKGETTGNNFSITTGVQEGLTYKVAVTTVTKTGVEKSIGLCPTAEITVIGKAAPPSDVTAFAASFANDHIHFGWNHITDVDRRGYEIRELPFAGASWNLGVPITAEITQNNYDYFNLSVQGNRYFAIKAIDTSGNYSVNATSSTLLIDQIPDINIIETVDFDLSLGTLTGDAERIMNTLYSNGDYYRTAFQITTSEEWDGGGEWDDPALEWDGDVSTDEGVYITPTVDLLGVTSPNISLVLGIQNEMGGAVMVEIAYDDASATPTNWTPFTAGQYSGRYFRFRITFSTTADQALCIYQVKAIFDVPDKEEQKLGVSVAGSGWTTITFDEDFIDVKGLIVSVVGNAYILEHDQTDLPTSFKVKLKDSAGVQQAGAVNYFVKGY